MGLLDRINTFEKRNSKGKVIKIFTLRKRWAVNTKIVGGKTSTKIFTTNKAASDHLIKLINTSNKKRK